MDRLTDFLKYVEEKRYEEDFVDRLFFRFSPRLFVSFGILIMAKEYWGEPIHCWAGAEWVGSWNEYANDYCFVEGTYYVNVNDRLEQASDRYKEYKNVDYYPWLAFILVFQAIICYAPYFIWSAFNAKSGLALKTVNSIANTATFSGFGLSSWERYHLSGYIHNSLRMIRQKSKSSLALFRTAQTFYRDYIGCNCLVIQYLFMKVMFIVLALLQIKFISSYMGKSKSIWDFAQLLDTFNGKQSWEQTGSFPRSAFCDFEIRGLERNVEKYTIQCVLVANMINEKIFIFSWWWLWILVVIGTINLLYWVFFLFWPQRASNYIFNAIVQGNTANEKCLHKEMQETWDRHQERVNILYRVVNFVNQQFAAQKLPIRQFDCRQIENEPAINGELENCIKKYWTFDCWQETDNAFMDFLGHDGVLFFRLMELNSSKSIVNEVLSQLYHDFVSANKNKDEKKKAKEAKKNKGKSLESGALPSHANHFTSSPTSGA